MPKRAAYSVVAVDGGSRDSGSTPSSSFIPSSATVTKTLDHTETVTASASTLTPSTATIVETSIESQLGQTKTAEVSVTQKIQETVSLVAKSTYTVFKTEETTISSAVVVSTTAKVLTASTTTSRTLPPSTIIPPPTSVVILEVTSLSSLSTPTFTSGPVTRTELTSLPPAITEPSAPVVPVSSTNAQWVPPNLQIFTAPNTQPTGAPQKYDDGMWHISQSWNASSPIGRRSHPTAATITP